MAFQTQSSNSDSACATVSHALDEHAHFRLAVLSASETKTKNRAFRACLLAAFTALFPARGIAKYMWSGRCLSVDAVGRHVDQQPVVIAELTSRNANGIIQA